MYIVPDEYWLFEDIKSLSGIAPHRLRRLIKSASKEIDEYCNTRLEPTEDNYSLDYCRQFHVRKLPLLEVTEILLNGILLAENIDYYVYPDCSKVEIVTTNTGSDRKAVKISYTYGYNEVPETIKQVIVSLIKLDVESGGITTAGVQSENWDGEYSYTKFNSKDMTVAELRNGILTRLDAFKANPCKKVQSGGSARARLI